MSEVIDTLNLLEVQIRVSEADEQIIRADERTKVRAETIDKLEQKLRIWDNKANAIPEYVWHCINEVRKYHE